ncbi:peptidylprolyl isomerase [Ottowia thiooxydans]|uniref:peptidylprolyl isomerase n=1 Tax=Ottowia thiooxydans TaxID=219182 RepID=UPI0004053794|nr:peptidylprolyl isomerase [Ottowia thiooxydans]
MLIHKRFSSLLFAAAALFSAVVTAQPTSSTPAPATATAASGEDAVILRGPGGEVTASQLLAAVERSVPVSLRESFFSKPQNIEQMALSIYSRQTLARQARQQGFDQKPEVAGLTGTEREQALADLWATSQAEARLPTPQQIEQYARSVYEVQNASVRDTIQLRVRHIMLEPSPSLPDEQAKAKADNLLAQLKAGAVFEELARAESTDQGSGARGGELQKPFELGPDRTAFESAAAELTAPGQISGVVKSADGYHIIQLIERKTLTGFERRRAEMVAETKAQLTARARVQVLSAAQAGAQPNEAAILALVRAPTAK